ncbi:MAG: putative Ig domain-containing protein, partial [Candidatus Binatia bacterium]
MSHSGRIGDGLRRAAAAGLACGLLSAAAPGHAALGDCGQPATGGAAPTASDALFTLGAAVGVRACAPSICDVDASCTVTATDALRVLQVAVGLGAALDCPASCGNSAPEFPTAGLYRTYPDLPIVIALAAVDPDGDDILYSSDPLPDRCSLDADTGVLTWTPTREQIGAYVLPVTATDDGDPRMAA